MDVKTEGPLSVSLSFSLPCSPAANGYPDVSQRGEVIYPFLIFFNITLHIGQVQQKDTHSSFHSLSIGRPPSLLKKQCNESHSKWL